MTVHGCVHTSGVWLPSRPGRIVGKDSGTQGISLDRPEKWASMAPDGGNPPPVAPP